MDRDRSSRRSRDDDSHHRSRNRNNDHHRSCDRDDNCYRRNHRGGGDDDDDNRRSRRSPSSSESGQASTLLRRACDRRRAVSRDLNRNLSDGETCASPPPPPCSLYTLRSIGSESQPVAFYQQPCPEIEWYNCCDTCLLEAKSHEDHVPSWMRDLAAVNFSTLCRKNHFCRPASSTSATGAAPPRTSTPAAREPMP